MNTELKFYDLEEVQKHCLQDDAWMIIGNNVLDITSFLYDHPGGIDELLPYLGEDGTEAFIEFGHSNVAVKMVNQFRIGYFDIKMNSDIPPEYAKLFVDIPANCLANNISSEAQNNDRPSEKLNSFDHVSSKNSASTDAISDKESIEYDLIDFNKPLLMEVAKLSRQDYFKLIDTPNPTTKVLQIFPIEPFEFLSKNSWYVIPLVYIPIGIFLIYQGYQYYPTSVINIVTYFLIGAFTWTFAEYIFHRFLFHYVEERLPDHYFFLCIHFLIHSVHHLLPMDPMRLVMPPGLFAIFVLPFWALSYIIFPVSILYYLWPGILFGYLCYDMIHYSSHHFTLAEFIPHLKEMRNYHMKHHYKFPLKGFGVSSKFWDRIFNTMID